MRARRTAAATVFAAIASVAGAAGAQLPLPTTTTTASTTTTTTTSAEPETTTTTSCGVVGCIVTTTTTAETTATSEAPQAGESSSLSISVPASADLGVGDGGLQAQLGAVTVSIGGSLVPRSFTATVTATDFSGSNGGTVANEQLRYASGPALAGTTAIVVPGQLTTDLAVTLDGTVTAFTGTGGVAATTATWNPTIIVNVPPDLPAGDYHGTITHSAF